MVRIQNLHLTFVASFLDYVKLIPKLIIDSL